MFRQLLYRVLHRCRGCDGSAVLRDEGPYQIGREPSVTETTCRECGGEGHVPDPRPVSYKELRGNVIDLQIDREINPTDGHLPDAFERLDDNHSAVYAEAMVSFDIAARREVSQADFGLEPLGLAMWSAKLPERTGQLEPLSQDETHSLLRTVARILAAENILLPPEPLKNHGSGPSTTECSPMRDKESSLEIVAKAITSSPTTSGLIGSWAGTLAQ